MPHAEQVAVLLSRAGKDFRVWGHGPVRAKFRWVQETVTSVRFEAMRGPELLRHYRPSRVI